MHVYQPVETREQEPAISVQHANSRDGTPIDFTGVLKYQTEQGDCLVDIHVEFDLTGAKKPLLSVARRTLIESATGEAPAAKGDFMRERESLGSGVKHVAVYAPEGDNIKIVRNGKKAQTTAVRQKFTLQ